MVGAVQKLAVKEALSFWYMQMNQLLYDLLFIKNQLLSLFWIFSFSSLFGVMGLKLLRCSNVKEFIGELLSNLISVMLN